MLKHLHELLTRVLELIKRVLNISPKFQIAENLIKIGKIIEVNVNEPELKKDLQTYFREIVGLDISEDYVKKVLLKIEKPVYSVVLIMYNEQPKGKVKSILDRLGFKQLRGFAGAKGLYFLPPFKTREISPSNFKLWWEQNILDIIKKQNANCTIPISSLVDLRFLSTYTSKFSGKQATLVLTDLLGTEDILLLKENHGEKIPTHREFVEQAPIGLLLSGLYTRDKIKELNEHTDEIKTRLGIKNLTEVYNRKIDKNKIVLTFKKFLPDFDDIAAERIAKNSEALVSVFQGTN